MNKMDDNKKKLYDKYVSSGQVSNIEHIENKNDNLFKHRSHFINNIINKFIFNHYSKDSQIIDIACGHGTFIHFLHKKGFKFAKGFDISLEQIEMGKKLGIKNLFCTDINQYFLNNDEGVDIFLLIDIIEHLNIDETMKFLEILKEKLNDHGIIIIHIPNAEGIYGMRIRYGDMTHETAFTPKSINQLLKMIGFSKVECFEDKPIIHGFVSFCRRIVWDVFTFFHRILLFAETGEREFILSQNMTVIVNK